MLDFQSHVFCGLHSWCFQISWVLSCWSDAVPPLGQSKNVKFDQRSSNNLDSNPMHWDHTLCRALVLPQQSPGLLGTILDGSPLRHRIPASWHSFCRPRKDDRQSQPHLVLIQQQNGIWTQDPRIPRITCKLFEKDTETLIIHQQMLTDESDSFTSFWWPIYTLIHLSLHAKQQRDRLKKGPDSNPGSTAQKWVCKLCISPESKISCHTGLPH